MRADAGTSGGTNGNMSTPDAGHGRNTQIVDAGMMEPEPPHDAGVVVPPPPDAGVMMSTDAGVPCAQPITVDGRDTFCTFREAIDAARSGSTILASPGVYNEAITISKSITIGSADPNQKVLLDAPSGATAILVTRSHPPAPCRFRGAPLPW